MLLNERILMSVNLKCDGCVNLVHTWEGGGGGGGGGVNSSPCLTIFPRVKSAKVGNLRKHMSMICYLPLTITLQ